MGGCCFTLRDLTSCCCMLLGDTQRGGSWQDQGRVEEGGGESSPVAHNVTGDNPLFRREKGRWIHRGGCAWTRTGRDVRRELTCASPDSAEQICSSPLPAAFTQRAAAKTHRSIPNRTATIPLRGSPALVQLLAACLLVSTKAEEEEEEEEKSSGSAILSLACEGWGNYPATTALRMGRWRNCGTNREAI